MGQRPMGTKKVIITGVTHEANELTRKILQHFSSSVEVLVADEVYSSVQHPSLGQLDSDLLMNGRNLARYCQAEQVRLMIDASDPFDEEISEILYSAGLFSEIQRCTLVCPPWVLPSNARWLEVETLNAAIDILPRFSKRPLLSLPINVLEGLSRTEGIDPVLAMDQDDALTEQLAKLDKIILPRPYTPETEIEQFTTHEIDGLVCRNEGSEDALVRVVAALTLKIPIVMISRPPLVPGPAYNSIDGCLAWMESQL